MKVSVRVGLLAEYRGGEGVLIPLDQYVQEGQMILFLYLHCELYLLAQAVKVNQEGSQLLLYSSLFAYHIIQTCVIVLNFIKPFN